MPKNNVPHNTVLPGQPIVYPTVSTQPASSSPLIENTFNNKNLVRVNNIITKCQNYIDIASANGAPKGLTALIHAAHVGDVACVKELVKLDDINAVTEYGDTALMSAIANGNSDMVTLLLANGANPILETNVYNGQRFSKITPYSYALHLSRKAQQGKNESKKIIQGGILDILDEAITKPDMQGARRARRKTGKGKGKSKSKGKRRTNKK